MQPITPKCVHYWKLNENNDGVCQKCGESKHFKKDITPVDAVTVPPRKYREVKDDLYWRMFRARGLTTEQRR